MRLGSTEFKRILSIASDALSTNRVNSEVKCIACDPSRAVMISIIDSLNFSFVRSLLVFFFVLC